MPNKKFCKKCGDKHVPPTGRNCVKSLPGRQLQSSPVSLSSTEASQFTIKKTSSADQATELQQEILKQLHRVNSRLDTVEHDIVTVKQATHKQTQKISSFAKSKVSDSEMSTSKSQIWKDQTDFEFGFIPLSDLHESDSSVINHLQNYCPIEAHKIVAAYGKPNYLGARIMVDTQLNLQVWFQELRDYWDQQLLDFLTFGFPLDFNRNAPLHWEGENHKPALQHPNDIEAYLKEEAQFKAIVGPFKQHPCKNGHISPFMTRDKPGSEHRRVIIDLSWPIGCSVNAGIDKTLILELILPWSFLQSIISLINLKV